MLRWFSRLLLFAILTVLTQIGGLVQLATLALPRRWRLAGFVAAYLLATLVLVPPLASLGGRERLPCFSAAEGIAGNPLTCLLNRGYVTPATLALVQDAGRALAARYPGSLVTPLDAGFPFLPGAQMPPHYLHREGLSVDLAFLYRTRDGKFIESGSPSPIGYFVVEPPLAGEAAPCGEPESWKRVRFGTGPAERDWVLDKERSGYLVRWLAGEPRTRRILLETHLQARFGAGGGKVRFQGCGTARHDDHLHLDVEP